ncbi:MAG: cyclic-di-AMP receptor [Chloroflexota bacterium]
MKLIIAIIQDRDTDLTLEQLTTRKVPVTRVATSGGFIREGNSTLLLGVDDTQVAVVTDLLQETCRRRKMFMPMAAGITDAAYGLHSQIEVEVGGATVFVFDVEHFEQV